MSLASKVTLLAQRIGAEIKALRTTALVYQPNAYLPGVPAASATMLYVVATLSVNFPVSLTGSYGRAEVAATASTVFTIRKNGASVGTATFAAGATSATFSVASTVSLAAGDTLSITAPASTDATLAGVSFALAGTRT